MSDTTAHDHLATARDLLVAEITGLDHLEAKLRTALDELLGTRTRRHATLVDLDQLLERLDPGPAVLVHEVVWSGPLTESGDAACESEEPQVKPVQPPPAARKPAGAAPSATRTVDYNEVAKAVNECPAGTPVQTYLADRYDKPVSTVRNWIHTCRKLKLLPPSGRQSPKSDISRSNSPADVTPAPRAPISQATGEHPAPPMSKDGPRPSVFKGPKVLACTECSFECDITDVRKLNSHTITDHGRRPSNDERTPVMATPA